MIRNCLSILAVVCLALGILSGCSDSNDLDKPANNKIAVQGQNRTLKKSDSENVNIDSEPDTVNITDLAVINTTMGKITIGLYGKDAPRTVRNFIVLSEKDYYNDVLFHRVARNFLIQTGDKNTRYKNRKADWGKGGESIFGKEFADELDQSAPSYRIGYIPGVVAMANRGPNTNTSQFFICLEDAVYLEHKWTIFGRVVDGMDVVEKISNIEVEPGPYESNDGLPKKPVKILSVRIKKAME